MTQNDFKGTLEQFNDRLRTGKEKLDQQVKTHQVKAEGLFEAAWVQGAMVYGLDNKLIQDVDLPEYFPHAIISGSFFMA